MNLNEVPIWEKLSQSRKSELDLSWLAEVYTKNINSALRPLISEKIGLMGNKGWPTLKILIKKYGAQSDLIYAAGICHQAEARNWLISLLNDSNGINLEVLQSLACWGAEFPNSLLKKILTEKSQSIRLAGLELLEFKSHKLSDEAIIDLLKEPLNDFREPILLAIIKILQRRNSFLIVSLIAELVTKGSYQTAQSGLLALGCIGNIYSQSKLFALSEELPIGQLRETAKKQLKQQYKLFIKAPKRGEK